MTELRPGDVVRGKGRNNTVQSVPSHVNPGTIYGLQRRQGFRHRRPPVLDEGRLEGHRSRAHPNRAPQREDDQARCGRRALA
ncbi:MAG: hypothetical protein WDN72_03255 [Alphaproteobacteria bacterium]